MRCVTVATAFVILLAAAGPALAIINPNFTPIHLVGQSTAIAVTRPSAPDAKGRLTLQVVKTLRGKAPAEKFTLELLPDWIDLVKADLAAGPDEPALLFIGTDEGKEDVAFLHLAGRWLRVRGKGQGGFAMVSEDQKMQATWRGGSDMLVLAVEYILSTPNPVVPVDEGCTWGGRPVLGKIAGPVHSAQALDLAGGGQIALFVAAEKGDRIYRHEAAGKQFVDATAALKLASKSQRALWADFTGDGRSDLLSWDGRALALWAQAGDGTFPAAGAAVAVNLKVGCLGLAALDAGVDGRPGALVTTAQGPVLLVPQKDVSFKAVALDGGGAERGKLGTQGACLVADFDGDGLADVLEPFAEASLFYKCQGAGRFTAAARCGVSAGKGAFVAWLGDYDADGRMDIFMSGEENVRLWHNYGGLKFVESLAVAGEVSYMIAPKAVCGQTFDINNDGRQDVMACYRDNIPWLFFNRGYRSFAKALAISEPSAIPELEIGTQAAVVEDFNGDGGQDLAAVLSTGEVRVLLRSEDDAAICAGVRAVLAMGKGSAGPVTVTGWAEERCLGAWSVAAGSPGALLARGEPGYIVLKWQSPDGKAREQKFVVENRPVRFEVPTQAKSPGREER